MHIHMNHPIKCVSTRALHSREHPGQICISFVFSPWRHKLDLRLPPSVPDLCSSPQRVSLTPRTEQNLNLSISASASASDSAWGSDSSRLSWKSKFGNRICMPILVKQAKSGKQNKTNQTNEMKFFRLSPGFCFKYKIAQLRTLDWFKSSN